MKNRTTGFPNVCIFLCNILVIFLLFTVQSLANDLYPSNCKPADGDSYDLGSTIPVEFDVCFKYDYPVSDYEWFVEVTIIDSKDSVVYHDHINGFDANGPDHCYFVPGIDFKPSVAGEYFITIETFYDQEIKPENDMYAAFFMVGNFTDLALAGIVSPKPMDEIFAGFNITVELRVKNQGNVSASSDDWLVLVYLDTFVVDGIIEGVDIAPGEEVILKDQYSTRSWWYKDGGHIDAFFSISYPGDKNESNNDSSVIFTLLPRPLWPNEFEARRSGLLKSNGSNADGEFIEILANQDISDLELCKVTVYDSAGHQVDTCTLDQFTMGETVDTFVVYTYSFASDILPDNYGGFAISYEGLPVSDFFLSWGGTITAVEGDWADSTSTDIGITPEAGSSIALVGNGTDFEDFSWEISTPSPGVLNSSQVIPVELVSFSASVEEKGVALRWITATEINNSGFEVERAVEDGSRTLYFESIGFVKGAGTTTESKEYSYIDESTPAAKLKYRLRQIDYNGSFEYSDAIEVNLATKLTFKLAQNYPNPFNPSTNIQFSLPKETYTKLEIFNALGQKIETLISKILPAGQYKHVWNANEYSGGVYFYRLTTNDFVQTKKLVLMK
jgi:hypothetical protein